MIINFENFLTLNETPDNTIFNGKQLTTYDKDAVSFCVLDKKRDDKFIVYVDHVKGEGHGDSEYKPIDENDPEVGETDSYPFFYKEFYGRVWLDAKVISFWSVPTKARTTGKSIIDIESFIFSDHDEYLDDKLENDLDLFNYYMEELKEKLVIRGFIDESENLDEWYIEKHNKNFIKVKDFVGGFVPNEEEYKYHLMDITDPRRKNRPKNFGSNKTNPIKWKQALLKSESLIDANEYKYYYGDVIEYKIKAWSTLTNKHIYFTKLGKIISRHLSNSNIIYKVEEFPYAIDSFGIWVKENDTIRSLTEEEALIYIDSEKYNL